MSDDKVYIRYNQVDKVPKLDDNHHTFRQFIQNKIAVPEQKEPGDYILALSFIVEKDGTFTNIEILEDNSPDEINLGQKAANAVSIYAKGKPAEKDGFPVRFKVTERFYEGY